MQVPYHRALIYLHGVDTVGLQFSWHCSTISLAVVAGVGWSVAASRQFGTRAVEMGVVV